jgi:two-component sensor histidine kinase
VDLLHRLRDSFSYPPDSFNFKVDLLPDILVKASIAPQIGMLITELAINVDQHAYHDISTKYIGIHILQFSDHLLINIIDQGHGVMKSKPEQRGHGLSIVETIAKQLRGTFQLQYDQNGTHAKLSLPLKNLL